MTDCFAKSTRGAVPITAVDAADLGDWLAGQDKATRAWIAGNGFAAEPGRHLVVPGTDGSVARVLAGRAEPPSMWDVAGLPAVLPKGVYRLEGIDDKTGATAAAVGWALGSYVFDRFKDRPARAAKLVWPKAADRDKALREAQATALCRDLVNRPANDLGPAQLAQAARALGRSFNAKVKVIAGDALLKQNFPAIHAVGRAAANGPRLIDLTWGAAGAPKVTLIGKGVCFDTGGLDLKTSQGMKLMKKDMGGAAHVLGLAHILMAAGAPIRLRVLIPAVENSVSDNAMRPLDILTTRRGTTVEIGNTDAEGRVIMSDALTLAVAENPEMIVDFATLTGAARVALGTELPAMFCNDDSLAGDILAAAERADDPVWRMPLWPGYRKMVEGAQADLTNAPEGGYGGAITAALFLEHFATPKQGPAIPWVHFDIMAWNLRDRPGRPAGGEAMGMRAVAEAILTRYTSKNLE